MRVLFLTHRLPYAPNRGDRVRAYHIARLLRPLAEVDLVSFAHDAEEEAHARDLDGLVSSLTVARLPHWKNRARAFGSLATTRPLTHMLLDESGLTATFRSLIARHPPDVVLAYCSGMARFAVEPLLATFPFVLDMVDLDSAKWSLLADRTPAPMRWIYDREARLLGAFERSVTRRAFSTVVVNERERETLLQTAGEVRVDVIGNGVDFERLRPKDPPSDGADVVFCGVMNYAPNEEAAIWLAREVWPLVRARRGDARLLLLGSAPTEAVRQLAADPSIRVTGHVDDVRPYLWKAAVAAAPLQVARGIQNKVLEAAAAGLPAIVTPAVSAGLPAEVLPACCVAESPSEFAAAIVAQLARPPAERRERASRADLTALSWEKRLAHLPALLREAAGAGT